VSLVVIYSGGLDSTVLLYQLRSAGQSLHCLSFNYGQKHLRELNFAHDNCLALGIPHLIGDLTGLAPVFAGSALTDRELVVPEGHYQDQSMRSTVVPNRNMIMLSLALGWAVSLQAEGVAYAAHAGDHAIYPDCRPNFVRGMQEVAKLCDYQQLEVVVPFMTMSKAEIVALGADLGVPFINTWSCYVGGELHCGKCGTCVERREAFVVAGVVDPTRYQ